MYVKRFSDEPGLEGVPFEVIDELRDGQYAKRVLAERTQRLAAATAPESVSRPGGPAHVARVHPAFYHFWGQKLGYECWEDDQFVHEFLRDNPECRVEAKPARITVGYSGPDKVKFHKKYG